VTGSLSCPRCGGAVRPPGLWSDSWSCAVHGEVAPLYPPIAGSHEALRQVAARSQVPVWLPRPLPQGWLLSGLATAGDDHTGPVATVVACSGPNPMTVEPDDERQADLLLVAEQPGVGLAAHLAGLDVLDPGGAAGAGAPHLKLVAGGHDTPLWALEVEGVAAYVGEAAGVWLWAITWPQSGAAVLLDQFELVDCRDGGPHEIPFGALSPRLARSAVGGRP